MTERPLMDETEVTELVRSIDLPAPAHLRTRIEAMIADHAGAGGRGSILSGWRSREVHRGQLRGSRARFAAVGGLVGAALAVALTIGTGGGGTTPINMRATASLALRAATAPAPGQSHRDRAELVVAVDGVAFPYWEDRFGWHTTGARTDRLAG